MIHHVIRAATRTSATPDEVEAVLETLYGLYCAV